jgi:lipooligosaccharide transport system ATP-binding protein
VSESMTSPAAPVVLSVVGLRKNFGAHVAVAGLDFQVRRGECFGLLGPNGAGKSTTLKLVLGLIEPDAGRIELLQYAIPAQARTARARVGVVPQSDALDPDFTVAENLKVFGRYFGMSSREAESRVGDLLEFAGLSNKGSARISELSGGMKRRLTIARALVNDPDVLFLDEPTTGLDPQARHLIWQRLKQLLSRGKTIVLTTHFMDEAERLCNHVMVIDHGACIAADSPAGMIQREIEPNVVEITGDAIDDWVTHARRALLAERIESVGETAFVYCHDPGVVIASVESHPELRYLLRRANLEDVFLKLTGRDLRD